VRFPAKLPRAFSVNADEQQWGQWFRDAGLDGMALLLEERFTELAASSNDVKGQARRLAVLKVTEKTIAYRKATGHLPEV
jgi:hypothetical protein